MTTLRERLQLASPTGNALIPLLDELITAVNTMGALQTPVIYIPTLDERNGDEGGI